MPDDLTRSRGKKPRRGAVLKCEQCGVAFYSSPGQVERRRYCSRASRNPAIARTQRTACVRCGKEFSDAPSIAKKWCSRACYDADRKPRRTCKRCGTPLTLGKRTWCSRECFTLGRINRTERPCEVCGVSMSLTAYQARTKRFCSRACLSAWKRIAGPGSRNKRSDGYMQVYYPTHPDTTTGGYMLEHRLVAEKKYGRRILPTEHVHHINGVRDDNRPENLEVISASTHAGVSNKMGAAKRKTMRERLAEYERRFGPLQE